MTAIGLQGGPGATWCNTPDQDYAGIDCTGATIFITMPEGNLLPLPPAAWLYGGGLAACRPASHAGGAVPAVAGGEGGCFFRHSRLC